MNKSRDQGIKGSRDQRIKGGTENGHRLTVNGQKVEIEAHGTEGVQWRIAKSQERIHDLCTTWKR